MKLIFTFLCSVFLLNAFGQPAAVFPEPKSHQTGSTRWYLPRTITVSEAHIDERTRVFFNQFFTKELKVNVVFVQDDADIRFAPFISDNIDHYTIAVTDKIELGFSNEASKLLLITTLKQLIQKDSTGHFLNRVTLNDHADYSWRGLHLDVSRHFFEVEDILWLLNQMAFYKLNKFHWHLTDDQGWRIEIKKYPHLTAIGGKRSQTLVGHASNMPEQYDGQSSKGFYTQADIQKVVKAAQALGIEVIPEIEMPGHARAALAAYPEFSCTGEQLPVAEKWGVFEHVYCANPATINFLKDVLREVLDLFPSKYIHIGGDEVPKKNWKTCPNCQQIIQEIGLVNEHQLQSHFLSQIGAFLQENNRIMIGWDEIMEGSLPENAIVMRWRGKEQLTQALEMGAKVIQSPNAELYFDHYQSVRPNQPLAIGGFTSVEEVYNYHLLPDGLESYRKAQILGGQANVWTEYIPNRNQLEYMLFPRLLALSEILWSENRSSYDAFKQKLMTAGLPRLEQQNVNYSNSIFETEYALTATKTGLTINLKPSVSSAKTVFVVGDEAANQRQYAIAASKSVEPVSLSVQTFLAEELVDTFDLNLINHPMLGQKWTLDTQPSSYYLGNNDFVLTDGIRGRRPWHGAEWLGFRDSTVELSIEWAEKQNLENLHLGLLLAPSSWIYLPDSVDIAWSTNGKKWNTQQFIPSAEQAIVRINDKAKFFKIKFHVCPNIPESAPGAGQMAWLFLDEVFLTFEKAKGLVLPVVGH